MGLRQKFLIGFAIILALGFAWYWWSSSSLAAAEEKERIAQEQKEEKERDDRERKAILEAHEKEREAWQEQMKTLAQSIASRDLAANRLVAAALVPKTQTEVSKDIKEILHVEPSVFSDGAFKVSQQDMQKFVANQIERERWEANAKEQQTRAELAEKQVATLQLDLARANEQLARSDKVIASFEAAMLAFKKEAKKSKLRRGLEITGTLGLTIAAGYIGAKAGR